MIGAEKRARAVPVQLAAAMRPQMHDRRPAARHGDSITNHILDHLTFAILRAKLHRNHAAQPFDSGNPHAGQNPKTARTRLLHQGAISLGAGIDDTCHIQPRLIQHQRGAISIIIVGHDNRALARCHTPVNHIIAHRGGKHHARLVIAREAQGPLQRTRRGNHPPGADAPQTMARPIFPRRVIGQPLIGDDIAMIIDTRRHAAQAQIDIRHLLKRLHGVLDPIIRQTAIDLNPIDRRAPTPMGRLLAQDDAQARAPRFKRRLKPRNPTARHDKIGMDIELLIAVGIGMFRIRRAPKPRRLPDEGLEDMFPKRTRMDEGLVIKPRRQKLWDQRIHLADIPVQARPMVLARGRQPVEHFGKRRALVRFMTRARAQIDQRVWLFRAAGHHAAWAVIFERPAHDHLTIGHQGRGQRIAGMRAHRLAVEGKPDLAAAVDQPAAGGKADAHVRLQSGRRAVMAAMISAGGAVVCAG